jgi:hypothetical protein
MHASIRGITLLNVCRSPATAIRRRSR